MGISAFCSGVTLTCACLALGLRGPIGPGAAASAASAASPVPGVALLPPVVRSAALAPAAAVLPAMSMPEGEGTLVTVPGDGARHHREPMPASAPEPTPPAPTRGESRGGGAEWNLEHLDRFATAEPVGGEEPSRRLGFLDPVLDAPPGEVGGAASRVAAHILDYTAKYRHHPTPTLVVDSDSGALLFGLTWRR